MMIEIFIISLLGIILCCVHCQDYDLPPLPAHLPFLTSDSLYKKLIPRKIWIAVKDRKDELPGHLKTFFNRNSEWEVNVCDNVCKDQFMNTTFAGSSVLWAYNLINPLIGASKADIWRYSVLYTFGGVYLDDDSDIKSPLDEIIAPEDALIMSEEGSSSLGDCYNPNYHLSDSATFQLHTNFSSALHFHGVHTETKVPIFFHDHTLINWAMFAAPRHPVFARTLSNIVEIIRSEYIRRSVVHFSRWDKRWKYVMCTTGFVLTYSVRELELENRIPTNLLPRISVSNFRQYGGNVKAIWTGADPDHYMKAMVKKSNLHLLREYATVPLSQVIDHLEGRTVMGDAGRDIFLVYKGQRRPFGGYDTFLDLGFTDKNTKHLADSLLEGIPLGPAVTMAEAEAIRAHVKHRLSLPALTGPNGYHGQLKLDHHRQSDPHAVTSDSVAVSPSLSVEETKEFLTKATTALNNMTVTCFGDDYSGSRDNYLKDVYKEQLGAVPVMVYPFCARTFQLGNTLGYFLNDLACADISGAHFVTVHREFNLLDPDSLVTTGTDRLAFFDALPVIHINSQPKDSVEVKKLMRSECTCLRYCWEHSKAPWLKRLDLIRSVLLPAIDAYVKVADGYVRGTVLNNATDMSSLPSLLAPLPLIPNVTIQYRCGDNIGFGKTRYGLLPFSAFSKRRIDSKLAEFIYVIADSPTRSVGHVYSGRCETILQKLFEYLRAEYPSSVVVIKRGGDAFLDYARIAYSDVTICSASTFCFWPAVSNPRGQVHFPFTPLIANAWDNETAPFLTKSFHWIREVEMIKEFKKYHPWSNVIGDLQTL